MNAVCYKNVQLPMSILNDGYIVNDNIRGRGHSTLRNTVYIININNLINIHAYKAFIHRIFELFFFAL